MIPKANQRAGGQQLATHLLNEFDNDRVEVADLRGAIAQDLHGAFAEWAATAKATQCRKYLYSLSVNPDPRQRVVTRDEYLDYIDRAEKALGLTDQPRAVVFHVKHGREHCHVVWSRINGETLKAVQLSHDRQKLRAMTQTFARDHGLTLPPGMQNDKGKDRFAERQKLENLAEQQQEERTGISKAERIEAITAAWRESDSGKSFVAALEERGYFLARGDKRAYVVVDLYGEIHSLARQIRGARTKEVKARLSEFPIDKLPDGIKAQNFARKQLEAQRAAAGDPATVTAATLRGDLTTAQAKRRADLDARHRTLLDQHRIEREALREAHDAEDKGIISERIDKQPKGVKAFLIRITGIQFLRDYQQRKKDTARAAEHVRQEDALRRRHQREAQDFQHHYRALDSLEKRELRSLKTALRREQFRLIARPRTLTKPVSEEGGRKAPALTPQQRATLAKMHLAAREITAAPAAAGRSANSRIAQPFNEKARPQSPEARQKGASRPPEKPGKLQEIQRAAKEITSPPPPANDPEGSGLSATANRAASRAQAALERLQQQEREQKKTRDPGPDRDR